MKLLKTLLITVYITLFLAYKPSIVFAQFIGGPDQNSTDSLVATNSGNGNTGISGYNSQGSTFVPTLTNLMAIWQVRIASSGACTTITPPSGVTLIPSSVASTTGLCQALFQRVLTSSDNSGTTYQFTWTGTANYDIAMYLVNNVSAVDVVHSNEGNGTSLVADSITTTTVGDYIMAFYANDGSGTWNSPPSPMGVAVLNDYPFGGSPNFLNLMTQMWQYTPGSTGNQTVTITGSNADWVTDLLALKPLYTVPPQNWGDVNPGFGIFSSLTDTGITGSSQCLHVNSSGLLSGTGTDCGSGYPLGTTAQIGGYSNTNTPESETVSGDATFTRTSANNYQIIVTSTNGMDFGTAALRNTGTSGNTIPLLNTTNTWSLLQTFSSLAVTSTVLLGSGSASFTNNALGIIGSSTGVTTFSSANASATNYTITVPATTDTLALLSASQTFHNKTMSYTDNTFTGGTATSAINAGVDAEHSTTVSGSTSYSLQSALVTSELFTVTASATITLPQASLAGQTLNAIICQNGTGGFTLLFTPVSGLTITGNGNTCSGSGTNCFPTFTTTANKCGVFSLHYTSTTTAYLVGNNPGPI